MSGILAMQCYVAWGYRAVELLQTNASLLEGSGQWNCCNVLSHYHGAVGSATPEMHFLNT